MKEFIKNNFIAIIIILLSVAIFRLPNFLEPTWHPDEGIYSAVAVKLNDEGLMYKDVWDNKTPAIYYTYSTIYHIFGNSITYVRIFTFLVLVLATFIFYFVVRKIFPEKHSYILVVLFVFFFSSPVLDGNVSNAENYFILFTLLGLFLTIKYTEKKNKLLLFFIGLSYGVGFMYKIHPIFEFFASYLYLNLYGKNIKEFYKNKYVIFLPILGFIIPISLYIILTLLQGNFWDFVNIFISQGSSYIKTTKEDTNIFYIFFDSLVLRTIIVLFFAAGIVLLYYKKEVVKTKLFDDMNKLSKNVIESKNIKYNALIYLVFIFALYGVFFSGKPYNHYVLQVIPTFLIILGFFYSWLKKKNVIYRIIYGVIIFVFISFTIFNFFRGNLNGTEQNTDNVTSFLNRTLEYYPYSIGYELNLISKQDYYNIFYGDPNSLNSLVEKTKDLEGKTAWVLGDRPWYYILNNVKNPTKYTTIYHLWLDKTDWNKFINDLENSEYILDDKNTHGDIPKEIQDLLDTKYQKIQDNSNFALYKKI